MIIYVDENMSHYVAKGLNLLQKPENSNLTDPIEVKTIQDDYGTGAKDEDWIPEAGKKGACIITQDYNIQRIKHQQELCKKYNLGMFYLKPPSRKGFSYWDMVSILIKHWPQVCNKASSHKKPFAFKITPKGKMESID